jgi:hypothetical protein
MDTVTVCNAALSRLGEARIVDLNADAKVSRACLLNFPLARDEVLRAHWWNFATERAALTELSTTPYFGYDHQYQLPVDCLRVIEVNGVSSVGHPLDQWEIEGQKLLSDEETVQIRYIKRITDLNLFDSLALEALIVLLASKLAPAIQGGSTSKATEMLEAYHRVIAPLARRIDGNENRRASENTMDAMLAGSRAITARGGYGSLPLEGGRAIIIES